MQLMGSMFFTLMLLLATVVPGQSQGFHAGGVASCSGCHSLHSPQTGSQWQRHFMQQPNVTVKAMTKAYLDHQYSEIPVSQWEIH